MVSSTEPRVTLGQQVLDIQTKYAGQKTQTIRETTEEMGKNYLKNLWEIVEANKHIKQDWYITEILEVEAILVNTMRIHLHPRLTRPKPEWGLGLYKVHVNSGTVTYEWGLPKKHEALIMMANPEGWDSKSIKDIRDFVEGTLV